MRAIRPLLLAAAYAIVCNGAAFAGGIAVPMDDVRLVAFKQPVATVYLGNSTIAELTPIDSRHVFVLGKTFGTTNLIALAHDNSVIINEPVTVFGNSMGAVTLTRGADSFTYTCTSQRCEAAAVPGDAKAYFENAAGQASEHVDALTKAASPSTQH